MENTKFAYRNVTIKEAKGGYIVRVQTGYTWNDDDNIFTTLAEAFAFVQNELAQPIPTVPQNEGIAAFASGNNASVA